MGDYIKTINLHFLSLNFCSRKQKYLEKRNIFKFSIYSVILRVFLTNFKIDIIAVYKFLKFFCIENWAKIIKQAFLAALNMKRLFERLGPKKAR